MKNQSIPPFYVGQRVVAISNHGQGAFNTGDEFTVAQVRSGCCEWEIDIGIRGAGPLSICTRCNTIINDGPEWFFVSSRFAPITSNFQTISFTAVLEKECELTGAN